MEDRFEDYISTKQAGERVGMDPSNVVRLLKEGKIAGVKAGRDWWVAPASLDFYAANKGWFKARRRKARKKVKQST